MWEASSLKIEKRKQHLRNLGLRIEGSKYGAFSQ